jgi:hypothetical protein
MTRCCTRACRRGWTEYATSGGRIAVLGAWRSLVSRSVWGRKVAGSNPAAPITKHLPRPVAPARNAPPAFGLLRGSAGLCGALRVRRGFRSVAARARIGCKSVAAGYGVSGCRAAVLQPHSRAQQRVASAPLKDFWWQEASGSDIGGDATSFKNVLGGLHGCAGAWPRRGSRWRCGAVMYGPRRANTSSTGLWTPPGAREPAARAGVPAAPPRNGFGQPEPWVTKRQLSEHLKVALRWIETQHHHGLPHVRRGSVVRYRISEVEAWLRGEPAGRS